MKNNTTVNEQCDSHSRLNLSSKKACEALPHSIQSNEDCRITFTVDIDQSVRSIPQKYARAYAVMAYESTHKDTGSVVLRRLIIELLTPNKTI